MQSAQTKTKIFADVNEAKITAAIADEFFAVFKERITSDVIIIGAGPAGLTAGRELSLMGYKVLIIE